MGIRKISWRLKGKPAPRARSLNAMAKRAVNRKRK